MKTSLYDIYLKSEGVCTDTRKIIPNSIFFSLKGANFDGNKYALDAIKKGSSFAVVDDPSITGNNIILVDDVLETLQHLANDHRHALNAKVIAITGSNGKTTTKELLYEILKTSYNVTATPGNFNNHIGLPLTILSAPTNTEILILEMGDNQLGDIELLCKIAEPEYGIITNIGKDHLGGYTEGFEGNIKAKKELFDYIYDTNQVAFVNAEDELLMSISNDLNKITYGKEGTSLYLEQVQSSSYLQFKSLEEGICTTQLVGQYNIMNIETAYCIAKHFDISNEIIEKSIVSYAPKNNRSQLTKTERNTVILDAYNANPSSVELALQSLQSMDANNQIAILGDMLELGDASKDEHQKMINLAHQLNINSFFIGNIYASGSFHEEQIHFTSKESFIHYLEKTPLINSLILLKGSRSMKMEDILPYL